MALQSSTRLETSWPASWRIVLQTMGKARIRATSAAFPAL